MKIPRSLMSLPFVLALAAVCAAQEPSPSPTPDEFQTKLESLMSETGVVIVKGYTRVGSMNGSRGVAHLTAWEVTEALTGRRERGVGVEIGDAAAANRPDVDERAYIDYDELAPLSRGIDYIMKLDDKATKLSRYEAQYQTIPDERRARARDLQHPGRIQSRHLHVGRAAAALRAEADGAGGVQESAGERQGRARRRQIMSAAARRRVGGFHRSRVHMGSAGTKDPELDREGN